MVALPIERDMVASNAMSSRRIYAMGDFVEIIADDLPGLPKGLRIYIMDGHEEASASVRPDQ
jgi:hypothetical protein